MVRDAERLSRSAELPVIPGLPPDAPGILAAMRLSPGLAVHLRGLADELLVKDFPGASLTRAERELLATAVSAENDCFYCMDSHGAFACTLIAREGRDGNAVVDALKSKSSEGLEAKMTALVAIARAVQRAPRELAAEEVARALAAGATEADTQLAVLIAAAFCMYNRMVDGLRARTPASAAAFTERAAQIAEVGYSDPRLQAVPR